MWLQTTYFFGVFWLAIQLLKQNLYKMALAGEFCVICAELLDDGDRVPFTCSFHDCAKTACFTCVRQYIINGEEKNHPECMFCHQRLNLDYFFNRTPGYFINELRNHEGEVLLRMEKNLLPQTMPYLPYRFKKDEIMLKIKENSELKIALQKTVNEIRPGEYDYPTSKYDRLQFTKVKHVLSLLRIDLQLLEINNECSEDMHDSEMSNVTRAASRQESAFIAPCTSDDGCRGFLNSDGFCSICRSSTCLRCRTKKVEDDEHKCDPDNVRSVRMINSETKPCPNCAARIYRPSGCDHMFCTLCKTGFSWRTGLCINDNENSNPYLSAYLREHGGENRGRIIAERDEERSCRDGHLRSLTTFLRKTSLSSVSEQLRTAMHECVNHVNVINRPVDVTEQEEKKLEWRIQFLMKKIDEKKWKSLLKALVKRDEKKVEIFQVMQMFVTTMTNLINGTCDLSAEESEAVFVEIEGLRLFFNEKMKQLQIYFDGNATPGISESWRFHSNRKQMEIKKKVVIVISDEEHHDDHNDPATDEDSSSLQPPQKKKKTSSSSSSKGGASSSSSSKGGAYSSWF
jgi:hypothetical protein